MSLTRSGGRSGARPTRRQRLWFIAGWAAYVAVVAVGAIVLEDGSPAWQKWTVAGVSAAIAVLWTGGAFRAARRSVELERLLVTESASMASFLTMLGSLTYSLFESWVGLPKLSMWVVFAFGMWTWAVLSWIERRKYP